MRLSCARANPYGRALPASSQQGQREAVLARLAQHTLLGTIGEPEEIALAHLYLMQNRYVTGTVLTVDGGQLLAG